MGGASNSATYHCVFVVWRITSMYWNHSGSITKLAQART